MTAAALPSFPWVSAIREPARPATFRPVRNVPSIGASRFWDFLPHIALTLVIGQYAHAWHLGRRQKGSLTETVRNWREYGPGILALPHPSPRNNMWLRRNPWFEEEIVPVLRSRVAQLLN